jgi:hypothetical protein
MFLLFLFSSHIYYHGRHLSEERSEEELPKLSIKDMLKVVPPPHLLKEGKSKKILEKRVKITYSDDIKEGHILIHPRLAEMLNIKDQLEISVKGRKRIFKAVLNDQIPEEEIRGNSQELIRYGIANNSIVVVRRHE